MGFFDRFDFSKGHLPPWLAPFIGLTRPLVTTLTAAILPLGGFSVFMFAMVWPEATERAVDVSIKFFNGLPTNLYNLIGTIVLAYTGAVTLETFRKPPQPSPENNAINEAQNEGVKPAAPKDTAPRSKRQ